MNIYKEYTGVTVFMKAAQEAVRRGHYPDASLQLDHAKEAMELVKRDTGFFSPQAGYFLGNIQNDISGVIRPSAVAAEPS